MEEKSLKTIDQLLKCRCGNPYNHYQPIGFVRGKVIVLVECWSGDLNKRKPRHLFLVKLKLSSRQRRLT